MPTRVPGNERQRSGSVTVLMRFSKDSLYAPPLRWESQAFGGVQRSDPRPESSGGSASARAPGTPPARGPAGRVEIAAGGGERRRRHRDIGLAVETRVAAGGDSSFDRESYVAVPPAALPAAGGDFNAAGGPSRRWRARCACRCGSPGTLRARI